jgi:hypothetical protein
LKVQKDLRVVFVYCDWFNNKLGFGVKHNKKLCLVEVNHKLRFSCYNPFVLAHQVEMVYYMSYPCCYETCYLLFTIVLYDIYYP